MSWFYSENQQKLGPVAFETIQERIKNRTLSINTLVWREGMVDWQEAGDVPELQALFATHDFSPKTNPLSKVLSRWLTGPNAVWIILGLIVGLSWVSSLFINDYNVSGSKNAEILQYMPKQVSVLPVPVNQQNTIWADGMSYEDKVKAVGDRLVRANSVGKNIKFSISYDTDEPYIAYTLYRDRHIIITNQALAMIGSDDELAALLGHEMAHIEYNEDSFYHKMLESGPKQKKRFKKEHEADILGATIAKNAGYQPTAAIHFFETARRVFESDLPVSPHFETTLKTHPDTQRRMEVLSFLVRQKFPDEVNRPLTMEWSLLDTIVATSEDIDADQAWVDQEEVALSQLKQSIQTAQRYGKWQQADRDIDRFNQRIRPYNQRVLQIKGAQENFNLLIEKFSKKAA